MVNIFAGVLSGASGGGGGLITTPLMVLLGLSPAQAIATAKFGGLGISIGASRRFYKEKITHRRTIIVYSILGVPLLYLRNAGLTAQHRPQWIKSVVLPLLAVSVFLQAVLGSGVGSLVCLCLSSY